MKYLSKSEYLQKMRGCWLGKSIGGTLGAPFEPTRGCFDVEYYTTDLTQGMLPNDDLDLQLVWLNVAERYKTNVNASVLADYWMFGILPNWAEYGVGKANLRMGLIPPVSGKYRNRFKDSNGAWIRGEIWACLAPGHPEIAVKYAYEDACVDHADEGVYGEVFITALESAAFVESDIYKLIDIGLHYIPENCDCAKAVRRIVELYRQGLDWRSARKQLMNDFPGSFGAQFHGVEEGVPNANWGYDSPNNIAITLIGWLWAGTDFEKALCITTGCGEDSDCTAGALGAILGILLGADGIPEKWKAPIGNEIKTKCVSEFTSGIIIPKTMDDLVRRTANLMPSFLLGNADITAEDNGFIRVCEGDELKAMSESIIDTKNGWDERYFRDQMPDGYSFRGSNSLMDVVITATDGIELSAQTPVKLSVRMDSTLGFCSVPVWATVRWLLPDGVKVQDGEEYSVFLNQKHCGTGRAFHDVTLTCEAPVAPSLPPCVKSA